MGFRPRPPVLTGAFALGYVFRTYAGVGVRSVPGRLSRSPVGGGRGGRGVARADPGPEWRLPVRPRDGLGPGQTCRDDTGRYAATALDPAHATDPPPRMAVAPGPARHHAVVDPGVQPD